LKKANELLKKGLGVDLERLTNREKTLLVDALKDLYRLPELLAQLELVRSSYFYHRARVNLADKYLAIRRSITEIFEINHRCYGYRRLQASLARQRVTISEKVVQRLMKQEGLVVAKPKRRRYGSYLGEISPAPENLINRDFQATAPNEKWPTDITEFQIPASKVYLSPIIDCFDGLVISWSIGTQPDAALVNTMLDAAIETVAEGEARPIVHSDRGAHYRWPGWLPRIGDAKLVRSMSHKGCSQDNAACEGFFGRLKTELFYPRDWKPPRSSSSSKKLIPTSAGTTRSGSRSSLDLSAPSNIERVLDLRHKTSPSFRPHPPGSDPNGNQHYGSEKLVNSA